MTMKILVLNSGSSSLKFQLFENEEVMIKGIAGEIGSENSFLKYAQPLAI